MSVHLCGQVRVGFSPAADRKWLPEGMAQEKLYRVYAYENGTLKRSDGKPGDAFYLHFIGEGNKPARLIHSNAVIVPEDQVPKSAQEHETLWNAVRSMYQESAKRKASADDRGF